MADFESYNPGRVTFSFKGANIAGYQDGTFIDAERSADSFKKHVGSLGDVTRTVDLDKSGKVTLTLLAQSPSNDILQAFIDADEASPGAGIGSLQILDHSGFMECHADIAWIMKRPKIDRAKEAGSVVWVFECAAIEINASGNV